MYKSRFVKSDDFGGDLKKCRRSNVILMIFAHKVTKIQVQNFHEISINQEIVKKQLVLIGFPAIDRRGGILQENDVHKRDVVR